MWRTTATLFLAAVILEQIKHGGCSESSVFVQTGRDVTLDVNENIILKSFEDFLWKHNTDNIIKYNGQQVFNLGKATFNKDNFSLRLNNVKSNASGTYTAVVSSQKDIIVAKYQVTVLDPVSPVNLTVKFTNSSDSCNYTVICTTQTASINATVSCNNGQCSLEEEEVREVTASGVSLHVYLEQDSIICNHSNQVSWATGKTTIKDLCFPLSANVTIDVWVIVTIVIATLVLALVIACFIRWCWNFSRRRRYSTQSTENTIYDGVAGAAGAAGEKQPAPASEYCLVGPHSDLAPSTQSQDITQAESIYSKENQPARGLRTTNDPTSEYCLVGPHNGPAASTQSQNQAGGIYSN